MRLKTIIAIIFLCCGKSTAQVVDCHTDSIAPTDSVTKNSVWDALENFIDQSSVWENTLADSLELSKDQLQDMSKRKKSKMLQEYIGNKFSELNRIDTAYITPQLYDFAFMVQNTNTFENFSVQGTGDNPQRLAFAPNPTFRLGAYFGWKWLFLGYTFDVGGLLTNKSSSKQKTEIDLSFYTSMVGIDLFYRKTGNDFRCTNLNSLFVNGVQRPDGISRNFDGLDLQTRGLNVYYIFNHHNFSYPAAFSQTTVQRRSCGSFKLGLSITHHRISFDHSKLDSRLLPYIDQSLFFNSVKYNDYCINFGYAYNWVFKRNWLLAASFSPGLSYNVTYYKSSDDADSEEKEGKLHIPTFTRDRLNFDFVLRIGLVYNNTKYFAGMSFIVHSFDYSNKTVRLNNSFGSLNFYAGLNFKRKKK